MPPSERPTVYRSAPTITAARLNRGDTCHAAWSLPFSSCLGAPCGRTNGRLTDASRKRVQKQLKGKREASIDEISMLSPERLFQIDRRASDATGLKSFFGNLLVRLSGDFLQLPPVRSSTLASSTAPPVPPRPNSTTSRMTAAETTPLQKSANKVWPSGTRFKMWCALLALYVLQMPWALSARMCAIAKSRTTSGPC